MKKICYFIFILLIMVVVTACQADNNINKNLGEQRRPDFGQPESPPEISGLVKSIIGNEVTILKIERPDKSAREENEDSDKSEDGDRKTQAINTGFGGGGHMPGMGRDMRKKSDDEDMQAVMIEKMKEMSTGEEVVTIPVGIRMLKPDENNTDKKQLEMTEANLGDIKQDKMLKIWLNTDITDRNIAEFVLVAL